jgi:hypothetical protein
LREDALVLIWIFELFEVPGVTRRFVLSSFFDDFFLSALIFFRSGILFGYYFFSRFFLALIFYRFSIYIHLLFHLS